MLPLPPMSFTGGHATGGTAGGASAWDQGGWTVNVGGSAPSAQLGGAGGSLLLVALALGAAWLLFRK